MLRLMLQLMRTSLRHTEEPIRINIARWRSGSAPHAVQHSLRWEANPMQAWLRNKRSAPGFKLGKQDFVDRTAAMRLWVTNIKAKDFKEVAEKSLPHETISATTDAYGDSISIPAGRTHAYPKDD